MQCAGTSMGSGLSALILAALLAFPAAPHGAHIPVEEAPVVGGDWRVRRGYSYGVIHEAQGIHVLYFLFDNGELAFFLNDPNRIPAGSVDMSAWPERQNAVDGIRFDDVNGDGYNDLIIPRSKGLFRVWLWNPEAYAFAGEYRDVESP